MFSMRSREVRVLVADDHIEMRKFLRQVLQHGGMQLVGEAVNGAEAVRQCQEIRPDVVVLDVTMPLLNGFEAARQISRLSPATKIVFLSGHAVETCAGEAFRAGGVAYVCKQHAVLSVLEAIEAVVEGGTYVSGGERAA